jgi:hypothetical protein
MEELVKINDNPTNILENFEKIKLSIS